MSVLNKNKDVSGVNGKSILLQVENDEAYGKIVLKKNYFDLYHDKGGQFIDRLHDCIVNWKNLNFCITRTENNLKIFNTVEKLSPNGSNYNFEEILFDIITLSSGKIYKLEKLFLVRQIHSKQFYHNFSPFAWLSDLNFGEDLIVVRNRYISELHKHGTPELESNLLFQKTFLEFLEKYLERTNKSKTSNKIRLVNLANKLRIRFLLEMIYSGFKFQKLPVLMGESFLGSRDRINFKALSNVIERKNF